MTHPKEELLPEEIWIEPKPATWGAVLFSVTDPNNTTAVKYKRADISQNDGLDLLREATELPLKHDMGCHPSSDHHTDDCLKVRNWKGRALSYLGNTRAPSQPIPQGDEGCMRTGKNYHIKNCNSRRGPQYPCDCPFPQQPYRATTVTQSNELAKLWNFVRFLSKTHEVSTETKQKSDYWANQFRNARQWAIDLIAKYNPPEQEFRLQGSEQPTDAQPAIPQEGVMSAEEFAKTEQWNSEIDCSCTYVNSVKFAEWLAGVIKKRDAALLTQAESAASLAIDKAIELCKQIAAAEKEELLEALQKADNYIAKPDLETATGKALFHNWLQNIIAKHQAAVAEGSGLSHEAVKS